MKLNFKEWLIYELDGGLIKSTGIGAGTSIGSVKPTPVKPKQATPATTQKTPEDTLIPVIQNAATLYQKDIQKAGGNVNVAAQRDPEGTFNILTRYNPELTKNKPAAIAAIKGLLYGDKK